MDEPRIVLNCTLTQAMRLAISALAGQAEKEGASPREAAEVAGRLMTDPSAKVEKAVCKIPAFHIALKGLLVSIRQAWQGLTPAERDELMLHSAKDIAREMRRQSSTGKRRTRKKKRAKERG